MAPRPPAGSATACRWRLVQFLCEFGLSPVVEDLPVWSDKTPGQNTSGRVECNQVQQWWSFRAANGRLVQWQLKKPAHAACGISFTAKRLNPLTQIQNSWLQFLEFVKISEFCEIFKIRFLSITIQIDYNYKSPLLSLTQYRYSVYCIKLQIIITNIDGEVLDYTT